MNYIKRAVENYRKDNPITYQELAAQLFPELTEKRSREKLSRWINGYNLDAIRVKEAVQICKVLNITPNELLNNEYYSNK